VLQTTVFFRTAAEVAEDDLATVFRERACHGWLQRRMGRLAGVVQGPRHLLAEAVARIPPQDRTTAVLPAAFSTVEVHPPLTAPTLGGRPVDLDADAVAGFVGVSRLGALRGWAVDLRDPMAPVRGVIRVDGEDVADVVADRFSPDVARAGFGTGFNGFHVPLPERWLDGGLHAIAFEVPGRVLLGISRTRRRLPVAPNLPERPWIADVSGSREEAVRLKVVAQGPGWRAALGSLLDDMEPGACFGDWGIGEAFSRAGLRLPGIRARMLEREGQWFSDVPCSKGTACCKHGAGSLPDLALRHACPLWPRHFASKHFTKLYAEDRGIRVPRTLAITDTPKDLIGAMGPRYVMKPENDSGHGLFLMHDGINLFDRMPQDGDALRQALDQYRTARGSRPFIFEELLVQEGVADSAPVIPLDYKLHVFGGRTRMIHVDDRNTTRTRDPLFRQQGWYTRDWRRAPVRMRSEGFQGELFAPPASLPEMLRLAEAIGADAGGVYLRIDFYATPAGPALGEVTPFSFSGQGFTPAGDQVLSALMEVYETDLDPA
jgi:hypothetical protein